jgi:hypothetical protein
MERDTQGFEHIRTIISRMLGQELTSSDLPEPPFDSPIETAFADSCFKFLSPNVHVRKQVEASTTHGIFRLDFLMSVNDKEIAIECDGKDFHEGLRDELRDAILLGGGNCTTIYHFRGSDLVFYPHDCVWLVSVLDKDLFSQRGHIQLRQLRCLTFDIRAEDAEKNESFFNIDPPSRFFWAFRRSVQLASKNPTLNYHWKTLYKFACERPSSSLDELYNTLISELHNLPAHPPKPKTKNLRQPKHHRRFSLI